MEKFGIPGMAHPSTGIGIHHNIEQPKGHHIPLPTPSVHSHHTHNGMTHIPVHSLPQGNHHNTGHHNGRENHTNHHGSHPHAGHHVHHSRKK